MQAKETEPTVGPPVGPPVGTSRRAVLAGAGTAAVAVLGGCATYGPGNNPPVEAEDESDLTEEPQPEETASGGGRTASADAKTPPPPKAIARTGDVPVGGGIILEGRNLVITQPQAGTFKAFSARCTHAGCQVAEVKGGTINCPCHGSAFRIADGSVAQGPAPAPLSQKKISVKGSAITLG